MISPVAISINAVSLWQRFDRLAPQRLTQEQLRQELAWCIEKRAEVRRDVEKTRPSRREKLARKVSKVTMYASAPVLPFSMTTASLIWITGIVSNRVQDGLKTKRENLRNDLKSCDSLLVERAEQVRALINSPSFPPPPESA